jgi:cell wall-associated NlpC family hydrolase
MSTLDEITKEKKRVGEALARVDAQREKLTVQLGELEAAERVFARYGEGTRARRSAAAKAPTTAAEATAPARSRRRSRTATAKSAGGKRSSLTLSDRVLALATGKTQKEIAAACKAVRPNHVGAAIARHKRAGCLEERDGKLYTAPSTDTAQRTAV